MPSTKNKVQPQQNSHAKEIDTTGVYQLANGNWAYRFCKSINGKRVSQRSSTDREGKPLLTERAAALAKEEAILQAQGVFAPVISTMGIVYKPSATLEEVYNDYCANGRGDRAFTTIKRQESIWHNYLQLSFGNKRFNAITLAEIQDYLANKYYVEGYSYRYIQSFLKMFYLLFGQAYNRNYMCMADVDEKYDDWEITDEAYLDLAIKCGWNPAQTLAELEKHYEDAMTEIYNAARMELVNEAAEYFKAHN